MWYPNTRILAVYSHVGVGIGSLWWLLYVIFIIGDI